MPSRIESALSIFTEPRHFKLKLFIEGSIIGLGTGIVISLFRYLLELSEENLPKLYSFLAANPKFIIIWLLALIFIGYVLHRILKCDAMTSGSGIPQIKGVLLGKMSMNWARVLVLKFVGAVLGIGAGLSLGREGPSVQLGACVGQGVGRLTHRSHTENHYLLTAGSGAGLAAAFNAPLAGVIFCLEELSKDFSAYVFIGAMAASVTATTVTQYFFGLQPVFHLGDIPVVSAGHIFLLLIGLGLFVGGLGLLFNKMLTRSLDGFKNLSLPMWTKQMLPLAVAALLGFYLPAVLGGGSRLVDSLAINDYALIFLVILFVGKFFFTMLCFGSGVPGGIFLPMLVLGAVGGAIFAKLMIALGLMETQWLINCIVFGMAAYFAAVVKSPITGAILIMEMTGSFEHLLALMVVSMTAYLLADLVNSQPVYDMLLNRSLALQQKISQALRSHRIMINTVVKNGSHLAGKAVKAIVWPTGSLLLNVKRAEKDLVPQADLQLQAGDSIYVLLDESQQASLNELNQEVIN